ncbi:MAG TPA: division/cell wall cluster transcriptional repressor MraZ [Candidatus Methylacidiphilales bacterium]|jgi:MraZ protein|nr:division/cell wall cluster transcriptional repressor MraZ [Candidatus Methylacidiphilales bacterium]
MSTEVRASYTDSFGHAFDSKGRITVPAEWRQPSFEASLFILPSSDRCLKVYPASWLGRLQEQVLQLKMADPMRLGVEILASKVQSATFDTQGRIMVKEKLRDGAGLKKEAVLVGRLDHFQIWDKAVWEKKDTAAMTVEEALSAIGL